MSAAGRGLAALIGLVTLALAWWWWSVALRKSLTTVPSTTEGSSPAGHGHESNAVAVGVGGTMRVVADRDRLLIWRDPMRRMPWLMLAVLTIVWPFLVVRGHGAVFAVARWRCCAARRPANQYGVEGSGLWLHLQTITDRVRARGEVLGHAARRGGPRHGDRGRRRRGAGRRPRRPRQDPGGARPVPRRAARRDRRRPATSRPGCPTRSRRAASRCSPPAFPGRRAGRFVATLEPDRRAALLVALPAGIAVVLSLTVSPVWGWVALVLGTGGRCRCRCGGRRSDGRPVPRPGAGDLRDRSRPGTGSSGRRSRYRPPMARSAKARSPVRCCCGPATPVW